MKRIIFLSTILIIIMGLASLSFAERRTIENDYIRVSVNQEEEIGFYIEMVEGEPDRDTDDDAQLLEGESAWPPSSFATIRIDGDDYIVGGWDGDMIEEPNFTDDVFQFSWLHDDDILVIQKVYLTEGPTTDRVDSVMIEFVIENRDDDEHEIGIRWVWDTYVDRDSGAGFLVYNHRTMMDDIVPGEFVYETSDIPLYWFQHDDIMNPSVRTQGTLIANNLVRPDKVVFANWTSFYEDLWDIDIDQGDSFYRTYWVEADSAVGNYWGPITLYPEERMRANTMFGVYGNPPRPRPEFASDMICATEGPAETLTSVVPFTITANVENTGDMQITGGQFILVPPDEFELEPGYLVSQPIPLILPGDSADVEWQVVYDPDMDSPDYQSTKTLMYTVDVLANYPDGTNLECTSIGYVEFDYPAPFIVQNELEEPEGPEMMEIVAQEPDEEIVMDDLWTVYNSLNEELGNVNNSINLIVQDDSNINAQSLISHHDQRIRELSGSVDQFHSSTDIGIRRQVVGQQSDSEEVSDIETEEEVIQDQETEIIDETGIPE